MATRAFIAFVGDEEETTLLCNDVADVLATEPGIDSYALAGDPFDMWEGITIDGRSKRTLCPATRFHFRWGCFITFLREKVQAAFAGGVQVILARRFGFDVVNGAEVFAREEGVMDEHDMLVSRYIRGPGLIPPLYIVTTRVTPWLQAQLEKYFYKGSGQRYVIIPHQWDRAKKVRAVVGVIRTELEGCPAALAA